MAPQDATDASAIGEHSEIEYGSDLVVQIVRDLGIEFIALNPGASYRGIHDSLVNFNTDGAEHGVPTMIECTQEGIAVAAAHGYAKASGKTMAVAIHNIVGLQTASMAIFNAWCDHAPMLMIGGAGPMATELRRPWIDWIHTALVQGNLIRDFVKWDDQPASHASGVESLLRGYRIAKTEPQGPVYVCFDAGLQEEKIENGEALRPSSMQAAIPARPPAGDPAGLREIAEAIRGAKWPVLIAGRVGQHDAGFTALAALSDAWSIPTIDQGDRLNLPNTHPMLLTGDNKAVLSRADVIVTLAIKDIAGAVSATNIATRSMDSIIPDDAKVFAVGLDEYMTRGWVADYQSLYATTTTLLADTAQAIPAIHELLGEPNEVANGRRAEIAAWHDRLRVTARETADEQMSAVPIALSSLAAVLGDLLEDEDYMIANGDLRGWTRKLMRLDEPRQFLGVAGGGGLGYGMGANIGACLAHIGTDKIVVNIQSDGDLMFSTGALWTLAHYRMPTLIIVNNNRSYFNDENHQMVVARNRNRDVKRAGIGTNIQDPMIDFAGIAESLGVKGVGPIEDPAELPRVLAEALAFVKTERLPILVDVVTQPS